MSHVARNQRNEIDALRSVNLGLERSLSENTSLQKQRFHLASIVEFSTDAITSVDLNGIVTSWNRAAEMLFGYSGREIVGQPVTRLVPADLMNEERELFARLRQGHAIDRHETRRVQKDGREVPVSLTASPIRDDSGAILGVSEIIHDLTEKNRVQEDLRSLQAEMVHLSRWNMAGTMASSLAHKIGQPLMATMNFMQASRNLLADSANVRAVGFLDKALKEIQLAAGIIRSLRTFIEKQKAARTPENLNEVLKDGLALSITMTPAAKQKVVNKVSPPLPPVMMDKVQIQQVLINLVRNAAEAVQDLPEGRVVVETRRVETGFGEPGFVQVSVSDNGPGLSLEALKQLFQPFVTTKKKGMGLGLSICRTIIETHGGRIWVEPNDPRVIAFHFLLPIATMP